MTEDYAEVIRNRHVTIAESHETILGVIVLAVTDEGFLIENVAVHPSNRGTGLGRAFLEFAEAEARRTGFESIYLYTHEQMTETWDSTQGLDTSSTTDAPRETFLWSS